MSDRQGRVVASGLGFCEGPVLDENGTLFVSSITHGAVYRVGDDGTVDRVADLGGGANAVTYTGGGRLVVAQNGGRWASKGPTWRPSAAGGLQIIHPDGRVEWLSHDPVAPNDLCVGPDGLVYSTDPTRSTRVDDGRLWRTDPRNGETELLASVPYFSNGIAFGPDGELYVASTRPPAMYVYRVDDDGALSAGRKLFDLPRGGPDGFVADADGNLLIGCISFDERPGTIQTWTPEGQHLETFTPGPHKHYTNMVQRPDGTLLVCDSDQGDVLAFDDWPARPLAAYPLR